MLTRFLYLATGWFAISLLATGTQPLLNDFESNGLQKWNSFHAGTSSASVSLVSPGQVGDFALKLVYNIGSGGWAGAGRIFTTPQNWGSYQAIEFGFYGASSGATIRFEILDNYAAGSTGDAAERFEYKFIDDFTGWKTFNLPWNVFVRRSDWQPDSAPNDGFNRTAIWALTFRRLADMEVFRWMTLNFSAPDQ